MRALTPAALTPGRRSPRLPRFTSTGRSIPNHGVRQALVSLATPTGPMGFRLRPLLAGSPRSTAESGSCTYGPPVRLRLLPTPPRGDAVTFGYRVVAFSGILLALMKRPHGRTRSGAPAAITNDRGRFFQSPLYVQSRPGQYSLDAVAAARAARAA